MDFSKKISFALLLTIVLLVFTSWGVRDARASEADPEARDVIPTFIGPWVSGGFNRIVYNDWFDFYQGTKKFSGKFYSAGLMLNVYSQYFAGEFGVQYMNNLNSKYPLWHLSLSANGKLIWRIWEMFWLTAGAGLFFETPPSNRHYSGAAGFQVPLGMVFNIGYNKKILLDVFGRYGTFGMGKDSTKLSYGISLGFVYKVGGI